MLWPLGQMLPFANIGSIIKNILGWKEDTRKARLLIMAGRNDRLMDVPMMQKLSALYRGALEKTFHRAQTKPLNRTEENLESTGVEFVVIENSGHHLQNDLQWKDATLKLLDFLNQL